MYTDLHPVHGFFDRSLVVQQNSNIGTVCFCARSETAYSFKSIGEMTGVHDEKRTSNWAYVMLCLIRRADVIAYIT